MSHIERPNRVYLTERYVTHKARVKDFKVTYFLGAKTMHKQLKHRRFVACMIGYRTEQDAQTRLK